MVHLCSACKIRKGTLNKYGKRISFHCFPSSDLELAEKWIAAVGRADWRPTKNSRLCSQHFREEDFVGDPNRKVLSGDAVPSYFFGNHRSAEAPGNVILHASLPREEVPLVNLENESDVDIKSESTDTASEVDINDVEFKEEMIEDPVLVLYEDKEEAQPPNAKTKIEEIDSPPPAVNKEKPKLRVKTTQTKKSMLSASIATHKDKAARMIKNLHRKVRRWKGNCAKLEEENKELKKRLKTTGNLLHKLDEHFKGMPILPLIRNQVLLVGRPSTLRAYSDVTTEFANDLYFTSAKAYELVQKYMTLPSKSMLNRWIRVEGNRRSDPLFKDNKPRNTSSKRQSFDSSQENDSGEEDFVLQEVDIEGGALFEDIEEFYYEEMEESSNEDEDDWREFTETSMLESF